MQSMADSMDIAPVCLSIYPRFLVRSQDKWMVDGKVHVRDDQYDVTFTVDPISGKVTHIEMPPIHCSTKGGT